MFGWSKLLFVFFFLSLLSIPIDGQTNDQDIFKLFWSKINDMVTPDWPSWMPDALPHAFFLMEMPGFAVVGDDYSEDAWQISGYDGDSPAYLSAELVDTAPAFANYFVDSGFRISKLWSQFMLNAQTDSPFDDAVRKQRYLDSVARLYQSDFSPKPVLQTRQNLLDAWETAFDTAVDNRYQCLIRSGQAPDYCAQKAVIWTEELSAAWFAYETLNRDLMGTQSQILMMQANDLHLLLSEAMEDFQAYERAEVGTRAMFATYYTVNLQPSDWWQWFSSDPALVASASNPFVSISFTSSDTYTEREATFDRFFGNNSANDGVFDKPLIRVTSADPSFSDGSFDLSSSSSSDIFVSFEIAKVKIDRPWLDLGLLRYEPIAITGLRAGEWSTGKVDGDAIFPLLPTAFIVARNIQLSSTGWSASMSNLLNAVNNTANPVSIQIGPFTAGTNNNQFQRNVGTSQSSSSFDSQTMTIPGPQIIGWVCTTVPYFPTANVEDLRQPVVPVSNTTNTSAL